MCGMSATVSESNKHVALQRVSPSYTFWASHISWGEGVANSLTYTFWVGHTPWVSHTYMSDYAVWVAHTRCEWVTYREVRESQTVTRTRCESVTHREWVTHQTTECESLIHVVSESHIVRRGCHKQSHIRVVSGPHTVSELIMSHTYTSDCKVWVTHTRWEWVTHREVFESHTHTYTSRVSRKHVGQQKTISTLRWRILNDIDAHMVLYSRKSTPAGGGFGWSDFEIRNKQIRSQIICNKNTSFRENQSQKNPPKIPTR
jgi:hypothetical protein